MSKKLQQVLAILGVILLISLYAATLVFAIIDNPNSGNLFKASIYATIIVPVLLYTYIGVYKYTQKNNEDKAKDESDNGSNPSNNGKHTL